jgi:hypothetical protein
MSNLSFNGENENGWNTHPPTGQGGLKEVVFLLQNNKNSISPMKYRKVNQIFVKYIAGKIFL